MQSTRRPFAGPPANLDQCRQLRAWAEAQAPIRVPAATQHEIETHLAFIASTLPSKVVDDASGKRRFAVYVTMLSGYSDAALKFMSRRALEELKWFPTPSECRKLIAQYQPPENEISEALRICGEFAQSTFDRWIANLADGQHPGDVPEQWTRIAVERGLMRRLDDGRCVSRALYQGPTKRVAIVA